ncbi:flippase [Flagellimonas aquimarina]|uniref:Flippase n=1 Tax=Flagellimonas aquimarina TaxID=2201895 RepID=A0A316L2H7_9FLAO|nr:flippase [Allomuricauda koreensis]PWL39155.1 flippase [Allomuricauda koreensis]
MVLRKVAGLLKNKKGFLKYLKNTSWLMGEKVIRLLIALTVGVMVTRYLGPQKFGILSYAQSFVGLFAAFSSLGLGDILVRELVKSKENDKVLLGTAFGLQTLGSGVIMLCLLTFVYFNDNEPITNKIILILGLTTFLQSFGVITRYFNSQVKSKFGAIPGLVGVFLSAGIKLICIWQMAPLIYFVYILAFDVFFLMVGQLYFYHVAGNSIFSWKFSFKTAKGLLSDSWPLILSSIVISIYMKVDQIMIQEIMDNSSVGQYSAAVRLSEAWYFIPTIICSSLFPAIINAKIKSNTLYLSRLQNLYDLMVILGLAIILPILIFGDWAILLLYGEAFDQTSSVLKIHIWAGVFVFLGVANQKWFISENLQAYNIICLGLGMVTNVILNLFLIPKYGIYGAAFATLISQFVASVLTPVVFRKTRPSFFMMLKSLFFISVLGRVLKNKSSI